VCGTGFRGVSDKSHLLINKKTLTTEESDMWSAYLPDASATCGQLVRIVCVVCHVARKP